jgi:uncharacterized protein YutE (UPF0331/DUF86 family)
VVDKVLLLRKLAELEEYLAQVKEYKDVRLEQYLKDWKVQRIIERTLQMMIEICADIAGHIISDRGYRIPTSYADTFRVLYEKDILTKGLFETMEKMSKIRNIIVHHYDRIDSEVVVNILRKDLDDFLAFKNLIINLLSH